MKSNNAVVPNATPNRNAKVRALVAAVALTFGIGSLTVASPAAARDEFKNAFEFELGRIVAHEVAAVGHAILRPHVAVHHEVRRPVVYDAPRYPVHVSVSKHHGPPRHARAHGYHQHHSTCGHRSDLRDRRDYRAQKQHARRDYRAQKQHARRDHRAEKRHDRREHRADKRHDRRTDRATNDRDRRTDRATNDRDRRDARESNSRDRHSRSTRYNH